MEENNIKALYSNIVRRCNIMSCKGGKKGGKGKGGK